MIHPDNERRTVRLALPMQADVSTVDRMIHPDNERRMAQRMNPRKTIELAAGHASLASQPGLVTDFIEEAAAG
ncbi:hypothetical protein OH809_40345 [Streptomyces sp. NBC_00873]|nr:hypothetical protein OH809_40345 [Streptomyces sp. NBC_00873]